MKVYLLMEWRSWGKEQDECEMAGPVGVYSSIEKAIEAMESRKPHYFAVRHYVFEATVDQSFVLGPTEVLDRGIPVETEQSAG